MNPNGWQMKNLFGSIENNGTHNKDLSKLGFSLFPSNSQGPMMMVYKK